MPSDLLKAQWRFTKAVALLLQYASYRGYEVTLSEAYRPKETAELYAEQGRGISDSAHCLRLAIDLNLFRDGLYLTQTEDYAELGDFWKILGGVWGGNFKTRNDGNHFQMVLY